jgi:hypothetical protein
MKDRADDRQQKHTITWQRVELEAKRAISIETPTRREASDTKTEPGRENPPSHGCGTQSYYRKTNSPDKWL